MGFTDTGSSIYTTATDAITSASVAAAAATLVAAVNTAQAAHAASNTTANQSLVRRAFMDAMSDAIIDKYGLRGMVNQ